MDSTILLVQLAVAAGLAFIPAKIAQGKGRSFGPWYVYGFFLFLIALIHSLVMKPKTDVVPTA
jgi:hypothetical protein